jgi:hypothetical protein
VARGPVGFQKSASWVEQRFHAARSYSLIRLPRTGRRVMRSWGAVNLLADAGFRGSLGSRMGWLWRCDQAAAGASPVTWFQVVNRVFISCRYWAAVSRWRRGRKWGDIPLNADRNRCARSASKWCHRL